MKKYKHLNAFKRDIISIELTKGTSKKDIANKLNIHISTLYRELNRNKTQTRDYHYQISYYYIPSAAHFKYLDRRKKNNNSSKFTKDVKYIIETGLKNGLSFSTICGIRHKTYKSFPCTRTLYNYFKRSQIKLPKNYRLKLKKRKSAKRISSYLKEANIIISFLNIL